MFFFFPQNTTSSSLPEGAPGSNDCIDVDLVEGSAMNFDVWKGVFFAAKEESSLYSSSQLKLKNSQKKKSSTYGEIGVELVHTILRQCRVGPLDSFIDIGCGS
jgi:hypothetical protein